MKSLIVSLHKNKNISYSKIAEHIEIVKENVFSKSSKVRKIQSINKGGKPKKTNIL